MAAHAADALGLGLLEHGDEVADIGVHVAIGQQADEMHGRVAVLAVIGQLAPGGGGENLAAVDGLVHQLGTLGIDLAAAQGVMAHLAIAHIVVGGQADGGTMGLDDLPGVIGLEVIKGGGGGLLDHIAKVAGGFAHTVHDNQHNGFLHME